MKLRIKILFIAISLVVIFFCAVYAFLVLEGKVLLIRQLEDFTKKKVTIGYFDISPPLNFEIKDLNIQDLTKIDSVFVCPSLLQFLFGQIAFNEVKIINPKLTYERILPTQISGTTKNSAQSLSAAKTPTATAAPAAVDSSSVATVISKPPPGFKGIKFPNLAFKHIAIENGKIDYIDRSIGKDGIKITVKEINFNLTNFYTIPHSVVTNFHLSGRIPWAEGKGEEDGKILAEGWFNFFKQDMAAGIKVSDIDGVYLYPYYSKWVDLEKARIERAKLKFNSDIRGLNNNVTADCHLELTDIVFKPRAPEEEKEKAERIAATVIDIFKTLNQGKIVLDFTVRTKMNRPEFGFTDIKMAFEEKLAKGTEDKKLTPENIARLPGRIIEGTVKGVSDISRAVLSGTFAIGIELKKALEVAFKREKNK